MIRIPFWLLLVVAVPYWVQKRRESWRRSDRPLPLVRELLLNAFFLYGLAVLYVTFFPLTIKLNAANHFNFSLFTEMRWFFHRPMVALMNIAGNVVMFMPLGLFLPLLFPRFQRFAAVVLAGFCCSVSIEFLQYLTATRTGDVDDILLNTYGAAFGFGLYALGRRVGLLKSLSIG